MQLSVVIPALGEGDNVNGLLPALRAMIPKDISSYEIIVVDGRPHDGAYSVAGGLEAKFIPQTRPGYGGALLDGFDQADGEYILTVEPDLSHPPSFLPAMWQASDEAEVVIASRYIPGGSARMPWLRQFVSWMLNILFRRALSLPVQDTSSGYRLYKAAVLRSMSLESVHFDILEEILIRAHARGWRIVEVPFQYTVQRGDRSLFRLSRFSYAYFKTLVRMWRLRNSIDSADYDYRAFDSVIPLQRYWQRTRHKVILDFAGGAGKTLDIGCGSSRILLGLADAIGVDVQIGKLRFLRRYGAQGLVGSAFALPFPDRSFDCLVNSQVIEHLPDDPAVFQEMARLVRPGGYLIIGTPDYGGLIWPIIEFFYARLAPGGYADEHITHYTRRSLEGRLREYGFECQNIGWVGHAEMIMKCVKTC